MRSLKLLAAAAIIGSLVAGPVMAEEMMAPADTAMTAPATDAVKAPAKTLTKAHKKAHHKAAHKKGHKKADSVTVGK